MHLLIFLASGCKLSQIFSDARNPMQLLDGLERWLRRVAGEAEVEEDSVRLSPAMMGAQARHLAPPSGPAQALEPPTATRAMVAAHAGHERAARSTHRPPQLDECAATGEPPRTSAWPTTEGGSKHDAAPASADAEEACVGETAAPEEADAAAPSGRSGVWEPVYAKPRSQTPRSTPRSTPRDAAGSGRAAAVGDPPAATCSFRQAKPSTARRERGAGGGPPFPSTRSPARGRSASALDVRTGGRAPPSSPASASRGGAAQPASHQPASPASPPSHLLTRVATSAAASPPRSVAASPLARSSAASPLRTAAASPAGGGASARSVASAPPTSPARQASSATHISQRGGRGSGGGGSSVGASGVPYFGERPGPPYREAFLRKPRLCSAAPAAPSPSTFIHPCCTPLSSVLSAPVVKPEVDLQFYIDNCLDASFVNVAEVMRDRAYAIGLCQSPDGDWDAPVRVYTEALGSILYAATTPRARATTRAWWDVGGTRKWRASRDRTCARVWIRSHSHTRI